MEDFQMEFGIVLFHSPQQFIGIWNLCCTVANDASDL